MISTPFLVALAATVVALVVVVWSGAVHKRSLHYGAVVAMLGLLTWAIREAEIMGRGLVYEGTAGTFRTVHFVAVCATFLLLPVLVVSGVRLTRQEAPARRQLHKKLAMAFVVAVLVTTALGTTMTLLATPVEEATGATTPATPPRAAASDG